MANPTKSVISNVSFDDSGQELAAMTPKELPKVTLGPPAVQSATHPDFNFREAAEAANDRITTVSPRSRRLELICRQSTMASPRNHAHFQMPTANTSMGTSDMGNGTS